MDRKRVANLIPWAGLLAVAVLWPRKDKAVAAEEPVPGLSEQRVMPPHDFDTQEPRRGRAALRPHHIPLLGWRDILWRTIMEINADGLPAVAGGVTFYALLAIFPAIGVFVSVYGLFADVATVQKQLQDMAVIFPASVVQIVGEQMLRLASQQQEKLGVALIVSLLLSAWSANAGMRALFNGLNVAYDETEKRNFAVVSLMSYGFTVAALGVLVVATAVLVAAPLALEWIGFSRAELWWIPLRWVAVLALAAFAFAVLYRYAPCRARARWRWVIIGAAFAALFWLAGSLGFSWYVNTMAHYDATYGPLGAVIAFMVWVWFSVMAVLLGAELNAEIEHQTAIDSTTGPERPMGERGAAMADSVGLAFHPLASIKKEAQRARRIAGGAWTRVRRR
ncbi:YihY/virulence factor BrkB family protein [Caulobacter segnis]|uniref:YihY/virulence factor BrkB family protein n=1 Tax=Caulobacter segnis TaxID=88688 RepID=UPI00241075B0|nr:YihY/virulence factor BrkB family protein [Caulobacter segnis]MDG2520902.1 YihY/virulence factor BrkB family protein [Caulobacter segnis]